jgi:hypothetical protein
LDAVCGRGEDLPRIRRNDIEPASAQAFAQPGIAAPQIERVAEVARDMIEPRQDFVGSTMMEIARILRPVRGAVTALATKGAVEGAILGGLGGHRAAIAEVPCPERDAGASAFGQS